MFQLCVYYRSPFFTFFFTKGFGLIQIEKYKNSRMIFTWLIGNPIAIAARSAMYAGSHGFFYWIVVVYCMGVCPSMNWQHSIDMAKKNEPYMPRIINQLPSKFSHVVSLKRRFGSFL